MLELLEITHEEYSSFVFYLKIKELLKNNILNTGSNFTIVIVIGQ